MNGKAEDVVDLVGIIGAAGGDHRVWARRPGQVGQDLGLGVGEGQNQGLFGHRGQPFGLEHAGRRQAEEHVGPGQHVGQRAGLGGPGEAGHVRRHGVAAPGVDHAFDVGQCHALDRQAHGDQQIDAGQGRGTRAGRDQLHVLQPLALNQKPIA